MAIDYPDVPEDFLRPIKDEALCDANRRLGGSSTTTSILFRVVLRLRYTSDGTDVKT
jgi:hypothetical protein